MDAQRALTSLLAAVYAAGSVWFYLHCVRPALLWHRAHRIAHVVLGLLSVVPAAAVIGAPMNAWAFAASNVAAVFLLVSWPTSGLVTRLFGGPALAKTDVDVVFGWLHPAGRDLDVGDLEAAQAQVDEARRHASPEVSAYVDLWDAYVDEERRRGRGERISRAERLKQIEEETARLVLDRAAIPPIWEAAIVIAVGVAVVLTLA